MGHARYGNRGSPSNKLKPLGPSIVRRLVYSLTDGTFFGVVARAR